MKLCDICTDVYFQECERACRKYLSAVDAILSRECYSESKNDALLKTILDQLKQILDRLDESLSFREEFVRRAYFLDLKNLGEYDEPESEELVALKGMFALCMNVISYSDNELCEVDIPDEALKGLEDADAFEQNTLVGAMRSPRQFGVSLKRKFYHIPAKYIEEFPIPKYIALYQSERMFGEELSGIKYYGEVKKCTPMRRSRIWEIPKKSNEIYYKFKIKSWKRLDNPIKSREIGFVRLFTSFFLLNNAEEVPDLTLTEANDFYLYKRLRLASNRLREDADGRILLITVGDVNIILGGEEIYACGDGRILNKYRFASFVSAPSGVFQKIKKDVLAYNHQGVENKGGKL